MLDKKKNHNAIYKFVTYWHNSGGAEVNAVGNASLDCSVSYTSNRGDESFRTGVTIVRNGYEDGKISLSELKDFLADDYHLDFSADFQNIRYHDKAKSLIIKSSSPKIGEYEVHLVPIV